MCQISIVRYEPLILYDVFFLILIWRGVWVFEGVFVCDNIPVYVLTTNLQT